MTVGQSQVGECILNFCAFKEAKTAVDAVGNARIEQQFFEDAGLCIGAVKYSSRITAMTLTNPVLKLLDDKATFVYFIKSRVDRDLVALGTCCP